MMNPYHNQFEQEILCAEPIELVVMLHSGLRDSIREARRQLATKDNAARAGSISKAIAIVGELARTLDMTRGGEMAVRLQQLYVFLTNQLLDGNYRLTDKPLAEAEAVVNTLLEAWTEIRPNAVTDLEMAAYAGGPYFAESPSLSFCG